MISFYQQRGLVNVLLCIREREREILDMSHHTHPDAELARFTSLIFYDR